MKIAFTDLRREWDYFAAKFQADFLNFGQSGYYVLGEATTNFEKHFAAYSGYQYAVAVSNGLAALKISLLAHGPKPDDEVITVANSAVATSLAISQLGAKPIFCDIKDDFLIDEAKITELITERTKAILPVHLFGQICALEAINKIATEHNLAVIEDACQAHGANFATLKNRAGLINTKTFSFYPTKNLGALGEGGMILTNDEKIRNFAASYRNYGQNGRYNHEIKGDNCRINALQCCFLDTKLTELDNFLKRRRKIAQKYITELSSLEGLAINQFKSEAAYHLFVIRVLNDKRDALKEFLASCGIETLIHYPCAIHHQPCYQAEYPNLCLKQTDVLQREILSLPCYPFLNQEEQDYVIAKIKEYLA